MMDDGHEWGGCWDTRGIHSEHLMSVPVRVGVIEVDGRDTIAIGVADEPPVALRDRDADDVVKLLGWAKCERDMLADLREQKATAALKESLNRALLTERQWHKVRRALEHDNISEHDVTVALDALRAAAPEGWAGQND